MRIPLLFPWALLALPMLTACEQAVDHRADDEMLRFNAYMRVNHPDLTPTPSGLYHIITGQGVGQPPARRDYVLFDYTLKDLDGHAIETTCAHTAWLHDIKRQAVNYAPHFTMLHDTLRPLIAGLAEGLGHMRAGQSARLIMPSALAYGARNHLALEAFSSVIIDVELHRVIPDPEAYEEELIAGYFAQEHPDLTPAGTFANGVYFLAREGGQGEYFVDTDVVRLNYIGELTNGFTFDTNISAVAHQRGIFVPNRQYTELSVQVGDTLGFIRGFTRALRAMRPGETAKVLIPSQLAYGAAGRAPHIQPYAPLVFTLTVLNPPDEGDE